MVLGLMAESLRYRAIRKIADGGAAEVFLGEQVGAAGFRRDVVLKRIHPRLWENEQFREMLIDEAHLAMSLTHPNLVQVLDVGESTGHSFLVLELVDGWTLGQVARRGYDAGLPIPIELSCYIAAEICRGLEYAHLRKRDGQPLKIVHRDICPNNVLVSMHAEVKVTDFGIARASSRSETTRNGMIRGKPMYMSPEQALGEPLDARSDLFSAGTVLFWLLTGELPFKGPGDQEYLTQIITTDAPSPVSVRPEIPVEISAVVQKAMARDRDHRFASARDLLTAIEQAQRATAKTAGRSELETWLRTLSSRDGQTPISRQTMPPAPAPSDGEWISLSAEQALVEDQTATQRALPSFAPGPPEPLSKHRRWPIAAVMMVLLVVVMVSVLSKSSSVEPAQLELDTQPRVLTDELTQAPLPAVVVPHVPQTALLDVDAAVSPGVDAGELAREAGTPQETAIEAEQPAPVSRSREGVWTMTARLAPKQPRPPMSAILIESTPPGLAVKVDRKALGRTPVIIKFRNGITYDVWFEGKGRPPLRRWLMLTERADGSPRVTLRAPVDQP
jgi:eukaryotic-like serine/threonine-protein kinase